MAGDLSRVEVEELLARLSRSAEVGTTSILQPKEAAYLLTLARSAPSEEELALRAAALKVGEAEAKREEWGDTVALHLAENELNQAASAFARTVEGR